MASTPYNLTQISRGLKEQPPDTLPRSQEPGVRVLVAQGPGLAGDLVQWQQLPPLPPIRREPVEPGSGDPAPPRPKAICHGHQVPRGDYCLREIEEKF